MEGNNLKPMIEVFDDWLDTDGDIKKELQGWKGICDWSTRTDEEKKEVGYILLNRIESTPNRLKKTTMGKGLFAQNLSYKLSTEKRIDFKVPNYIKEAIKWAVKI